LHSFSRLSAQNIGEIFYNLGSALFVKKRRAIRPEMSWRAIRPGTSKEKFEQYARENPREIA
jgi:hypothetical protein